MWCLGGEAKEMDEADKEAIIDRYNERFIKFGYSPKALGWDKGLQGLRYHILLSHWPLQNKTILDFGCGFGDMFEYCCRHDYRVNYEGININENLLAEGARRHPGTQLSKRDAFVEGLARKYDYIFS